MSWACVPAHRVPDKIDRSTGKIKYAIEPGTFDFQLIGPYDGGDAHTHCKSLTFTENKEDQATGHAYPPKEDI